MNKLKRTRFFSLGQKWFFTLALFLLVFAAASAVKIQGAPLEVESPIVGSGSVAGERALSGWIWGGSEDGSIGGKVCTKDMDPVANGCLDGNETGVGWINVNCASKVDTASGKQPLKVCDRGDAKQFQSCNGPGAVSCGVPTKCIDACSVTNYKVTISADGALQGNGWSENLGWIQFDPDPAGHPTNCGAIECPGFSSKINGNHLEGWARVTGIANDGSSGGWGGWINLSGTLYKVSFNDTAGILSGYGWNGETGPPPNGLGAMNFDRVSTEPSSACSISFDNEIGTLGASLKTLDLTYENTGGNINIPPPTGNINLSDDTCSGKSGSGTCTVDVTANSSAIDGESVSVTASTPVPGCSDSASGTVWRPPIFSCSCGSADGKRYCNGKPADPDLCPSGVSATHFVMNDRNYTWDCGSCPCSANRICGWIETNP